MQPTSNLKHVFIAKAALWEAFEVFLLFVIVPLAIAYGLLPVSKFPALFGVGLYCIFRLWGRVSFKELFKRPPPGWWKAPLLRAGIACAGLALFQNFYLDDPFFYLIIKRPWLWAVIMVLYPVASVLPQEIIFRVFLYEAHTNLLRLPLVRVLVSAALFGLAHIIYAGYFAMLSSFLAGIALSLNYEKHRGTPGSLWPLLFEHALYGQIVYTLGLGKYFFVIR